MPAGEVIETGYAYPPLLGLNDSLDPALPDNLYDPRYCPSAQNMRFRNGKWETRLGSSYWKILPGSGDVRLFDVLYTSTGGRWRLAARGTGAAAAFYDYEEGVDSAFQTTTGGTGLGGTAWPYFNGVTLDDKYYFTDKVAALKVYTPSSPGVVATVVQPAGPVAAPTPVARPYRYLENWSAATLANWTESDAADFELTDDTSSNPAPDGGKSAKLAIKTTSATSETISETDTGMAVDSHHIAWWYKQSRNRYHINFDFGLTGPTDFSDHNRAPSDDEWYPKFIPIGGIGTLHYMRFRVVSPTVSNEWISRIILPGYLDGQYRYKYTHYNPSTGQESEPSPETGIIDVSTPSVSDKLASASAMNKSIALIFASDVGTDATTTKVRFYRNGGVPALTKGEDGRDVWFRVGEVSDLTTSLATSPAAGATSFDVGSSTGFAVGDTIVLEKGVVGKQEFVTIANIGANTITAREPLLNSHTSGADKVQMAFLDNTPNENVDSTLLIDEERDGPPAGARWVGRAPDGRLWLFGYTGKLTGIRVSNKPTPERPTDYTVFPADVDPQTRRSLLQGFGFELGGDAIDEEIIWGGFFQGLAHVLTKRNLYQINALSQLDWSPTAILPVAPVGCVAGDTVQEVGGYLFWVAPGPQLMRWDGRGAPEPISGDRIKTALTGAPTAYWVNWFARGHAKRDGFYYCLYYTPAGATTNTARLDLNIGADRDGTFEPMLYVDSAGTTLGFRAAQALHGGSDIQELYQVEGLSGRIYRTETGSTDDGAGIPVSVTTKKIPMGLLGEILRVFLRGAAVTDTLTLTVTTGGSEYRTVSHSYSRDLSGSGDIDLVKRVHRDLKGRWVSFQLSGTVSNRPALREIQFIFQPLRVGRYTLSE